METERERIKAQKRLTRIKVGIRDYVIEEVKPVSGYDLKILLFIIIINKVLLINNKCLFCFITSTRSCLQYY